MKLRDLVAFFDFTLAVEFPWDKGVEELRQELIDAGLIDENWRIRPLLRLKDDQGANMGNIEGKRWCISDKTVAASIIDRLNPYMEDYLIAPIEECIHRVAPSEYLSKLDLAGLVKRAEELEVDLGDFIDVANAVLLPETVDALDDICALITETTIKQAKEEQI